jgi:single-strand DNA-binding protein
MNRCVLSGRLTADPELKQTPNGVFVTSFTIAVDRVFTPKGAERQADFIDVTAWRQTAEFVCKYFTKGKWIEIDGTIQTRSYTDKNNNKRKAVEIVADHAGFGGAPKDGGTKSADGEGRSSPPPPSAAASQAELDPFAGSRSTSPPPVYAAPAYVPASGNNLAEIDDDGDLPF